jgi:phosphate transport system permease protein
MDNTAFRNEREIAINSKLKSRHAKARAFQIVCFASTWVGLIFLVLLLWSVGRQAFGYMWERTLTNPQIVHQMLAEDPSYMERAEEAAWGFTDVFGPLDESAFEPEQIPMAHLSHYQDQQSFLINLREDEPEVFAMLGIAPTTSQRIGLLGNNFSQFFNSFPSRNAENAGIKSAIWGTLWMISITALIAIPLGVASAIYLEEYTQKNRISRLIEINIANLAGVPSIVYGLLGLSLFVGFFSFLKSRFPENEMFNNPRNVMAGALTMTVLILPVIIISAREAIKAVPASLRQAAYGVGATRWQVVRHHVLPAALPGIITGVILSISRAIGETAPLIAIGALTYVAFVPDSVFSGFTALPIQVYNWVSRPQKEFHDLAASGIIVLMVILLSLNAVAVAIRHRAERSLKW